MQDIGNLVYVPRPLRLLILGILLVTLGAALGLVGYALAVKSDAALVAAGLGLAQSAATGFLLALLVFYTRRTVSFGSLTQATERFLKEELKSCIQNAPSALVAGKSLKMSDQVTHLAGENICTHDITFGALHLKLRVMLNVRRIVVIYFLPVADASGLESIERLLEPAIFGARHVGYEVKSRFAPPENAGGQAYVTLHFYNNALEDDFLQNASSRYFWAQDIAQMTRSIAIELARDPASPA